MANSTVFVLIISYELESHVHHNVGEMNSYVTFVTITTDFVGIPCKNGRPFPDAALKKIFLKEKPPQSPARPKNAKLRRGKSVFLYMSQPTDS